MATDELQSLQEQGFPPPPPPPASTMPPGGGTWVIPAYQEFASVINAGGARAWRVLFDEALNCGGPLNALAMRHDAVIMDILQTVYTPVVMLEWLLDPDDADDPRQAAAALRLTKDLQDVPMWQNYLWSLLEAIWFGKSAVQNAYWFNPHRRSPSGALRLGVRKWTPVHGDSLVCRWSDEWGVLVHGAEFQGTTEPTDYFLAHFLTPAERERFVIHQHQPEMASFTEAQQGGKILGVGMRDRLWHVWWIRSTVQTYMLDFVQRLSQGFTIYFYEAGNAESMKEVQAAAQQQLGQNTILFPRYKDQRQAGPGVERIEVSPGNQQLITELVTGYYDGLLRRYGLMQSLTSEVGRSELGGDAASGLEAALSRCIKYHAVNLADTLNRDLIPVLAKYNEPGLPPPRFKFVIDKPDADKLVQNVMAFVEVGVGDRIDLDVVLDMAGIPRANPGHANFAPPQPQPMVAPGGGDPNAAPPPMESPNGAAAPVPIPARFQRRERSQAWQARIVQLKKRRFSHRIPEASANGVH